MKVIKNTEKFLKIFSIFIALSIIAISFSRPLIPWDSWAYHFPFSAQLFNINDYFHSFALDNSLEERFKGFPLAAEFLQGLLWAITNSLSSMALINSIPLFLFIWSAEKYGYSNFAILVFGILSFPQIAIHASSTYIDLFMGISLSFQYLAAVILHRSLTNKVADNRLINCWLIIYILSATFSGNTKMWAPLISCTISIIFFISILKKNYFINFQSIQKKFFIVLVFSVIFSCGTLIKNTIFYKNPVYPIQISLPVFKLDLIGPEIEYKQYPGYADKYGILSRPLYFIFSITEWDWVIRGVESHYTIDSSHGDNPKRHSPARTGGWWGLNVIISIFLLSGLFYVANFTKFGRNKKISTFPLMLFSFLTILTSFMPQSHELRYFLYWPILLIFNLAYLARHLYSNCIEIILASLLYIGMFFYSLFVLQTETINSLANYKTQKELIGVPSKSEEILSAKKKGKICLGPSYNPNQFKYSSVFQGGHYFVEQGWLGCKKYQDFKK